MYRLRLRKSNFLVPSGRQHLQSFESTHELHDDAHLWEVGAESARQACVKALGSSGTSLPTMPRSCVPILRIEELGTNKTQLLASAHRLNNMLPEELRFNIKKSKDYKTVEAVAELAEMCRDRLDDYRCSQPDDADEV
jgi:hypothetical protein